MQLMNEPDQCLNCLFFLATILTEINISFTPKSLFTRRRKMINGNVISLDPVFHHPAARSLSRCLSSAACLFTFQTVLLTVIYRDNVDLIYSPKYENISFRGSFPRLFQEDVRKSNPFYVIQHYLIIRGALRQLIWIFVMAMPKFYVLGIILA